MTDFERGQWRISGPLTVSEVPECHADSVRQRAREGMPAEVDLGSVEATDSSALALLLEWLSWARAAGAGIAFTNPPDNLRTIAGLSNVDGLLGWNEEGTKA